MMDCTFMTDGGKFNYRVGAVVMDGRRVLMACNPQEQRRFYYSVGGRVKFGETLEEAMRRELREEIGLDCEIGALVCLHENFFVDDNGVPFHEISAFFHIEVDERLRQIASGHLTDHGPDGEFLEWIDLDHCEGTTIYPDFFKTLDGSSEMPFLHIVTKEDGSC